MGQDEVLNYMLKRGKAKEYTAVDISVHLNLSPGSVLRALKGLERRGYVSQRVYSDRCFKYKIR